MNILWMTWKDGTHPLAGGAEVVNEELAKRLVASGHTVHFLVGGYKGAKTEETINGFKITRLGNRVTVYWAAFRYYRKHLKGWADLVIDEVNTVPFFAKFYVKERTILFVHMLCRVIWFYELPFPLSLIGYLLEPLYLRMLANQDVITVSESTKQDLMRHGFTEHRIHIISEGLEFEPLEELPPLSVKFTEPTLLSFGSMRSMKRTIHQIKAFEIAKKSIPNLKLVVAGDSSGTYGRKVLNYISQSQNRSDIDYRGRISNTDKLALMRQCHSIVVTSIKEGWGLTVTEANSQGTPGIVYDVDGYRDSVRHNETGIITARNTPASMAASIVALIRDDATYANLRANAWDWSKQISFDQSYKDFTKVIGA